MPAILCRADKPELADDDADDEEDCPADEEPLLPSIYDSEKTQKEKNLKKF